MAYALTSQPDISVLTPYPRDRVGSSGATRKVSVPITNVMTKARIEIRRKAVAVMRVGTPGTVNFDIGIKVKWGRGRDHWRACRTYRREHVVVAALRQS